MGDRSDLVATIADELVGLPKSPVLRVAVDGVDGAGKTTFADELGAALRDQGQAVIKSSVDGFHNPRLVRYHRGRKSSEGYFRDSYNYDLLRTFLLDPLSPGGSQRLRRAAFDHRADDFVDSPAEIAPPQAVLVFDGIFLHRPELRAYWDYSVLLQADFATSFARCSQRQPGLLADPLAPANHRYLEGQRIYLNECKPELAATLVIDNNDLSKPYVVPPRALGDHHEWR
jgi:uridine kinase